MNTLRDNRRSALREEKARDALLQEAPADWVDGPGENEAVVELLAALPQDLRMR